MRRFLESHGESIECVVFAVSDAEEVCSISYQLVHEITSLALATCIHHVQLIGLIIFPFVWTASYLKKKEKESVTWLKVHFCLPLAFWLHSNCFGHLYAFGRRRTCSRPMWLAVTLMGAFLLNVCYSGSVSEVAATLLPTLKGGGARQPPFTACRHRECRGRAGGAWEADPHYWEAWQPGWWAPANLASVFQYVYNMLSQLKESK